VSDARPAPTSPSDAPARTDAAWLTVVGCLPGGALAQTAPAGVLDAEAVFGAARLLAAAGVAPQRRRPWPQPFSAGIDALLLRRGTPTTVLASGDPLHHGVATTLLRRLPATEMVVHPAPSAFSLAAAAMRWPLEDVRTLSLHGAPEETVRGHLAPGRRLIVLTRDGAAPQAVASVLEAAGYGESEVTVLENLGGPEAARHEGTARTLAGPFARLNTLAIACRRRRPVAAGDLEHDGCVTRDEVRRLTIAALGDGAGHLWDIGAGSGAVAIDWCRAGGTATLFERAPARAGAIARTREATATTAAVLEGDAARLLPLAARPDAVFMGGAVGDHALFTALWDRLRGGGVFVSNAVTVEGEAASLRRFCTHGGALTRIALSHARPVGRLAALAPAMPVLQWRAVKPEADG